MKLFVFQVAEVSTLASEMKLLAKVPVMETERAVRFKLSEGKHIMT
jgi:hypothetical protein